MVLLNKRGKINFLRVHDVGTGWGPSSDFIDVECVIMFPDDVAKGYGFQLRNDSNENAHKGMLDLLRDAFNHDWTVSIDYHIESGKKNGVIIRVMLLKSPTPDPETPEDPLDPEDPVDPIPPPEPPPDPPPEPPPDPSDPENPIDPERPPADP